jgi:hypothetical protein
MSFDYSMAIVEASDGLPSLQLGFMVKVRGYLRISSPFYTQKGDEIRYWRRSLEYVG